MIYGALKVECIVVANGKEALEAYQKSPNFAHILVDIHMPVKEGYDSTKQIRLHENQKDYPGTKFLALEEVNIIVISIYKTVIPRQRQHVSVLVWMISLPSHQKKNCYHSICDIYTTYKQ
ncbi:unnamed protein product (macronuclear) [Paramecium tetraurelia]|uniref:Response regulatory domain-containing protein n=1 Tax=Paramecium tetraurelia TaxID=5888 RepID=A0C3J0_PARTE|nr:uncharacterized protein GSPATT00034836001 [Paramecium tetraurelia]CAK65357.1 unnamed protein product [Paramecium tetraurelia]|eukprot:XP_001432754.1 hypothetical protein (macronuclear) [Paramecium tetraurelia strain d4-2]